MLEHRLTTDNAVANTGSFEFWTIPLLTKGKDCRILNRSLFVTEMEF